MLVNSGNVLIERDLRKRNKYFFFQGFPRYINRSELGTSIRLSRSPFSFSPGDEEKRREKGNVTDRPARERKGKGSGRAERVGRPAETSHNKDSLSECSSELFHLKGTIKVRPTLLNGGSSLREAERNKMVIRVCLR